MQAIVTTYHGPTNTRGSRIVARSASGQRVSLPFDWELDHDQNHCAAAVALARSLGWSGTFASGGLDADRRVHVPCVASFIIRSI